MTLLTLGTVAYLAGGTMIAVAIAKELRLRKKRRRLLELAGGKPTKVICAICERELKKITGGVYYHADRRHHMHRPIPLRGSERLMV